MDVWKERAPTLWLQAPWYLSVENRNELQVGKCAHYTGIVYDSVAAVIIAKDRIETFRARVVRVEGCQ